MVSNDIQQLRINRQSVASRDDVGTANQYLFFVPGLPDTGILPAYGTRTRDMWLRQYYYALHNTMVQSAIVNTTRKVVSTSWEIVGKRNVPYFQDVLVDAHLGKGWEEFLFRVLQDFFTQDFGAFIEIIGAGNPETPLKGRVLGVAHLDSLRVYHNPDRSRRQRENWPFYYRTDPDDSGQTALVKMHRSRIMRLVDAPSADARLLGNGFCAMSRLMSTSYAQQLMRRYIIEKLSDLPPAGAVIFNNIGNPDAAIARFKAENRTQGNDVWSGITQFTKLRPNEPASIDFLNFSQLPDQFNRKEYTEEDAIEVANAIGIDPQDIRPISGGSFGTGMQSVVLAQKGRGKVLSYLFTSLERRFNFHILPPSLEFQFKQRDGEQEKEDAERAKLWVDVTAGAAYMDDNEKRQLIANTIPQFADVLLDEDGNIRLVDVDPKENPETEVLNADATQDDTSPPITEPATDNDEQTAGDVIERRKDYQATTRAFLNALDDLFTQAENQRLTRARAGTVLRANLRRLGQDAYKDGLEDGGVQGREMDDDDRASFNGWLASQSTYVTQVMNRIYRDSGSADPEMWVNKSLNDVYRLGLLSADRNGMYEWRYGDTEHCRDCRRLNGQRHRLKDWHRRILPGASTLDCKGYRCKCEIVRVQGRARGQY